MTLVWLDDGGPVDRDELRRDFMGERTDEHVDEPDAVEARLRELEALADAATPGPLVAGENYLIGGWRVQTGEDVALDGARGEFHRQEDAEFYAAARDAVPWLIAQLRAARADVEAWQQAHHAAAGGAVAWRARNVRLQAALRRAEDGIRASTESMRLVNEVLEAYERATGLPPRPGPEPPPPAGQDAADDAGSSPDRDGA